MPLPARRIYDTRLSSLSPRTRVVGEPTARAVRKDVSHRRDLGHEHEPSRHAHAAVSTPFEAMADRGDGRPAPAAAADADCTDDPAPFAAWASAQRRRAALDGAWRSRCRSGACTACASVLSPAGTTHRSSTRRRDVCRRSAMSEPDPKLGRPPASTHGDSRRGSGAALFGALHTTGGYDCVYALTCLRCASSCVCRACARLRARSASRATHSRRSRGAIHHHLLHLTDPSTTMTLRCRRRRRGSRCLRW